MPDGRERMGRRGSNETPGTWSLEVPSTWFYRLEMFTSDVDQLGFTDALIRRLGPSDLEALRSAEKQTMVGGFAIDYGVPGDKRWYEVVNDQWPWVIEITQKPKEFWIASVFAEFVHNAVQSALRIVDESFFFTFGPAVGQAGVPGSLMGQFGLLPRESDVEIPEEAKYRLSAEATAEVKAVWLGQMALEGSRAQLAVRRFNLGYERRTGDDSLIDLWIGLEALFSESGTDISYKAAMRIAYYLGKTPDERKALFKAVKDSYNVRSRLVHGDPLPLGDARKTALSALRRALARSMTEKSLPDPPALDLEIAAGSQSPSQGPEEGGTLTNPPAAPPAPGS